MKNITKMTKEQNDFERIRGRDSWKICTKKLHNQTKRTRNNLDAENNIKYRKTKKNSENALSED